MLSFSGLEKKITKMIPISNEKAWMHAESSLYIVNEKGNLDLIYENGVDDFANFSDGSLLILSQSDFFIKRRLQSGKLVPFTSVKSCYPVRLDINSKNEVAIIVKRSEWVVGYNNMQDVFYFTMFCGKGIKTQEMRIGLQTNSICGIKHTESNSLYFVHNNYVTCRDFQTNELTNFSGVFGMTPSTCFETYGIAILPDESVVVIDRNNIAILLLDKNLVYKKTILDATNNLEEPSAVAFYNNKLWVIDRSRILILNYEPK